MAIAAYVDARRALFAALHVQIVVERVDLPTKTPGAARIGGTIGRVFRGHENALGTNVLVALHCARPHDEHLIPPGSPAWFHVSDLEGAKVLEVFLNTGESGYELASERVVLLKSLTEQPTRVVTSEEAAAPRMTAWSWFKTVTRLILPRNLIIVIAVAAIGIAVLLAGLAYVDTKLMP